MHWFIRIIIFIMMLITITYKEDNSDIMLWLDVTLIYWLHLIGFGGSFAAYIPIGIFLGMIFIKSRERKTNHKRSVYFIATYYSVLSFCICGVVLR